MKSFLFLVSSFLTPGAEVISGRPIFVFDYHVQEIDCMISTKIEDIEAGEEVIISGNTSDVIRKHYQVTLTLHSDADLENVGHEWEIADFKIAQLTKMLL